MNPYNRGRELEGQDASQNPLEKNAGELSPREVLPGDTLKSGYSEAPKTFEREKIAGTPEKQEKVEPTMPDAASAHNQELANIQTYDEEHQIKILMDLAGSVGLEGAVEEARKLYQKGHISDHALDEFHDRLTAKF